MIIISVGTSLLNNLLNPSCEIKKIFTGHEDHKGKIQNLVNNFAKKKFNSKRKYNKRAF